ncbi:choline-phosphate cytidylyltransferase [Plakobranchus ocellatus]|uniref:choline-phosphate cytidylyltransferase n=1 Tax=Plakobranchus ocellatus TaxID=259542 RepID=A0AAV3ZNQ5_9GAST|nr:choline-phosphate cytidylyltransferase [Plakobranchus ocellatus]
MLAPRRAARRCKMASNSNHVNGKTGTTIPPGNKAGKAQGQRLNHSGSPPPHPPRSTPTTSTSATLQTALDTAAASRPRAGVVSSSAPVSSHSMGATARGGSSQASPGVTLTPGSRKRHRGGPEAHATPACGADREVENIMGEPASGPAKLEVPTRVKGAIAPAPFSYEQDAIDTRNAVDYTIKISLEEARSGKVPRPVRIYADGIYDMFHTGHARQLMQAKMAFPNTYLIVGICSDELTLKRKGRTVMNETERYEAVRHCRYVDEVVTDAPWLVDPAFLENYKIDFVAHDELPYTTGSPDEDVYKFVKDKGINLARGYSHKELNVSYMKAKHLKLKDNYEKFETKLKDKGKDWMGKWKDQLGKGNEMLHKWEEKSKEFIGNFVEMFGRDGRLDRPGIFQNFFENFPWQGRVGQWFQENTQRIGRAISPSASPLPFSPPSPSTSDPSSPTYASPPQKRRRYTPPLMGLAAEDSEDDDDDEDEEEEYEDVGAAGGVDLN